MPSPCEVVPNQEAAVVQFDGERPPRRGTRVIPALVGGVFAGLLLIGLGCTPLFQPAGAKAAAEQPTIVQSPRGDTLTASKAVVSSSTSAKGSSAARAAAASPASGVAAVAASSSHGFTIECAPPHDGLDAAGPRPETVALQGIMNGQSSKAALLDGALYREGDRFGSNACPWTVAMIDVASVRIEKTFGDRTCGVTISFSREKTQATQRASMN